MPVIRAIRSLVGRVEEAGLYECRRCGASVDGADEPCPECGAEDVAYFLL